MVRCTTYSEEWSVSEWSASTYRHSQQGDIMSNNPFLHLDPQSPSKKKAWEDAWQRFEHLFKDLNQAAFGGKCEVVHDEDTGKYLLIPNIGTALIKRKTELSVFEDFQETSFLAGASLCVCPAPLDEYFRLVLTTWKVSRVWNVPNRVYVGVQYGPYQQYSDMRATYESEIIKKMSDLARTMLDHLRATDCI